MTGRPPRKRGRPPKAVVLERPKKFQYHLLKKPKYLLNQENKGSETPNSQCSTPTNSRGASPDNNELGSRSSRSFRQKQRLSYSSVSKRGGRSGTHGRNYQFKSATEKSSEYHYGSDFEESSDRSDFEDVKSESEMDDTLDMEPDTPLTDDCESESSIHSSDVPKNKVSYIKPPSPDPIWLQDIDVPPLELPKSSEDLLVPKEHIMQTLSIYEVLRHFRNLARLSPFRLEEFCGALMLEEQNVLLVEIHIMLLKAIFREEDSQQTHFGPLDQKDSVNACIYFIDPMTWPEVLRSYVESDKSFDSAILEILVPGDYPFCGIEKRLKVLQFLTDQFLVTNPVREDLISEGPIHYDDHCRICHRLGDLLCCETCPAVYHLECVDPPLTDVPEEDWQCNICRSHKTSGVTDCILPAEKTGTLSRHEHLGFDRHGRKYWFLCRRIFVETEDGEVWYYTTRYQLEELLDKLDEVVLEKALYREINNMKDVIVKHMNITEAITNSLKAGRKSYLEVENAALAKLQQERIEQRQKEEEERRKAEEERLLKEQAEKEQKEFEEKQEQLRREMEAAEELNRILAEGERTDQSEIPILAGEAEIETEEVPLSLDNEQVECEIATSASATEEESKNNELKLKEIGETMTNSTPGSTAGFEGEEVDENDDMETDETKKQNMVTRSKTGSLKPLTFDMEDLKRRSTTIVCKEEREKLLSDKRTLQESENLRLTRYRAQQIASGTFLYKLGQDNNCKNYVNQYTTNIYALNKPQRNEERDKKRHLSHKFSLTAASEFKWAGSVHGPKALLINTLRQTILQLESNIPTSFMHINWPLLRKTWITCVQACIQPKDFGRSLVVLQACIKPVVYASVWHEQLGHVRLQRVTAVEREERKKIEKREKKEKEDEEERNRLAINFVKYTLGLKHSIQKQKGEEYRIHGQWGWRWLSSTRKLIVQDARTMGLRAGPQKIMVQVKDGQSMKLLAVDPGTYGFLLKKCDSDEEADRKKKTEGEVQDNVGSDSQQEWSKESETDKRLNNLRVFRPISQFETIDIMKALTSPGRLQYPKIAKKSKLDDFLLRRSNLKLLEERKFIQMGIPIGNKSNLDFLDKKPDVDGELESLDDSKKLNRCVPAGGSKEATMSIAKKIVICRKRYKEITGYCKNVCYSVSCRETLKTGNCYSPLCLLRHVLKQELTTLLNKVQSTVDSQGLENLLMTAEKELQKDNQEMNDLVKKDLEQAIENSDVKLNSNHIPKIEVKVEKENVPDSYVEEEVISMDSQICGEEEIVTSDELNPVKKEDEIDVVNESPKKSVTDTPIKATPVKLDSAFSSTEGLLSKILSVKCKSEESDSKGFVSKGDKIKLEDGTEVERIYSSSDTTGKIYLKKLVPNIVDRRKKKNTVKYPLCSTFLSKHNQYSLMILPKSELRKLARNGGKLSVNGFHHLAKSNTFTWPYPSSRPLFKTCWLYRTTTIQSIPAISLQLRILWACLRWDDMQVKPQSTDGKNQITTDTEIMTLEILKHRHIGENLEKTQYLRRKIVIPLELPKTIREVNPIRSGLRKRKREETPQNTEPQVSEEWVDEDKLELWEIKQYCEKLEKANNITLTRSRTGSLTPKPDSKLDLKGESSMIKAENIITKGTPEEIKEKMELQLRAQRAAHYQKKNVETMVKASGGQIIKLLPGQQVTADGSVLKVMTKPVIAGNAKNTLTSILTSPSPGGVNKTLIGTRKIFMSKDGTAKVVTTPATIVQKATPTGIQQSLIKIQPQPDQSTVNIQGALQTQTVQLASSPQQPIAGQTLVSTPIAQQPQRVHIIRGNDGKIQVRGLVPGQQLIQMADGKLHVLTGQISQAQPQAANQTVVQAASPAAAKVTRADGVLTTQTVSSPTQFIVKNAQGQQVRVVTTGQNIKQLQQNYPKSIIVKQDGTKVVLSQPQPTTQNIFAGQTFTPNSVVMRGNQVIGTTNEKGQVVLTSRVQNIVTRNDKPQARANVVNQRTVTVTNATTPTASPSVNIQTQENTVTPTQNVTTQFLQTGHVVVNNPVLAQQIAEGKLQLATINGQQVLIRATPANSTGNVTVNQQAATGNIVFKQNSNVIRQTPATNHLQKLLSPNKSAASPVSTPKGTVIQSVSQQGAVVTPQAQVLPKIQTTQATVIQSPVQNDLLSETAGNVDESVQKVQTQFQGRQTLKTNKVKTEIINQNILSTGEIDGSNNCIEDQSTAFNESVLSEVPEMAEEQEQGFVPEQNNYAQMEEQTQPQQEAQETPNPLASTSTSTLASTVLVDNNAEIERQLLVSQPPGTVIKCVTAQVIQTAEGPKIVLQGIQGADFTPQQLNLVQQQVKQQLLKNQAATGRQGIMSPTKIYLAVQPPPQAKQVNSPNVTTDSMVSSESVIQKVVSKGGKQVIQEKAAVQNSEQQIAQSQLNNVRSQTVEEKVSTIQENVGKHSVQGELSTPSVIVKQKVTPEDSLTHANEFEEPTKKVGSLTQDPISSEEIDRKKDSRVENQVNQPDGDQNKFVLTHDYIHQTIKNALKQENLNPEIEEKLIQLQRYQEKQMKNEPPAQVISRPQPRKRPSSVQGPNHDYEPPRSKKIPKFEPKVDVKSSQFCFSQFNN
ncbi:UNVERIFIED_CONTAM: hypothetical protein PYX00_005328 [Menopon gallinae]|uniref:Nucleosome-remodeling factor subunit NURF301 n=1 Tax=Menopon gallinae TaxID=328185 RepID=A0AAW2HRS0_9NEOP